MKTQLFTWSASLSVLILSACSQEEIKNPNTSGELVIGISTLGIAYDNLPVKSDEAQDLMAIQIYQVANEEVKPYAQGLFSDWSQLQFKGYHGVTYQVEATMIVDGSEQINHTDNLYSLPFETTLENQFEYSSSALTGLDQSNATLADTKDYTLPTLDRYYGFAQKTVSVDDALIQTQMKRVSFGVTTKKTDGEVVISLKGAPAVTLEAGDTQIFSLQDISAAYAADESIAPYSESIPTKIEQQGATIWNEKVTYLRNKKASITVESNDISFGFETEVPFEELLSVAKDNLYYNETQLGVTQNYWVTLEDDTHAENISWYVNNEKKGTGTDFEFEPTTAGSYEIKYIIEADYTISGVEVSESTTSKVYTSPGIYILNEPNMTADDHIKGYNQHFFAEETVTRFIEGSSSSFGTTSQYTQNWAGKLYTICPYGSVNFSHFDASTGELLKALGNVEGQTRAFAGITPEQGIITTETGAFVVNLTDFTLSNTPLTGSTAAKNILIADGYAFIICKAGAVAYALDDLSKAPIHLGKANTGFVKSTDGMIWAANGNTLLRINPKDLTTSTRILPNGIKISFSSGPWKQASWCASTAENAFYFTKDSWGSGSAIYRYDIDEENVVTIAEKPDFNNYMLYGTCLHFDAERQELIAQGMKGYGANSAYNGIWFFDREGEVTKTVLYDTADSEIYSGLDMWFPAMMTPIKNY